MNIANRILGEVYFITIIVVDWVDIFTRPKYKHIILDSLAYCQQKKGLKIYAWVLMSNHLHMLVSVGQGHTVADVVRDFKKFTSKKILSELEKDVQESRREWMLEHSAVRLPVMGNPRATASGRTVIIPKLSGCWIFISKSWSIFIVIPCDRSLWHGRRNTCTALP